MEIIISPIHKTFFTGRFWYGLDIEKIAAILKDTYGHRVTIIDFAEVASDYRLIPPGACWFYTPSYDERYNRYIRDVIVDFDRSRKDVVLIPDLDQLFSFENKGYQELYKKRLGIEQVRGQYFGDQDEFTPNEIFNYPLVLKKINGAVSSGVTLIKNKQDFNAYFKRDKRRGVIEWLRFHKRRYLSRIKGSIPSGGKDLMNFNKFFTKRSPFVIQEFILGLTFDYRVLVCGGKFYTFKREVRDNDFRASGSGKFSWIDPPHSLLDYADAVWKKMNIPFCSLDIGEIPNGYLLFEYQGSGFGPLAIIGSSFYYTKTENGWTKTEAVPDLDEDYAQAIDGFLTRVREVKS